MSEAGVRVCTIAGALAGLVISFLLLRHESGAVLFVCPISAVVGAVAGRYIAKADTADVLDLMDGDG